MLPWDGPPLCSTSATCAGPLYVNMLGFLYIYGDPASPIYAIVERGSAEIRSPLFPSSL